MKGCDPEFAHVTCARPPAVRTWAGGVLPSVVSWTGCFPAVAPKVLCPGTPLRPGPTWMMCRRKGDSMTKETGGEQTLGSMSSNFWAASLSSSCFLLLKLILFGMTTGGFSFLSRGLMLPRFPGTGEPQGGRRRCTASKSPVRHTSLDMDGTQTDRRRHYMCAHTHTPQTAYLTTCSSRSSGLGLTNDF